MANPATVYGATRATPRMDRQIERILTVLRQSPLTVPQLAKTLYMSDHTAGNYIRMLYRLRQVYISGWFPTQANKPTRIYSAGRKKDMAYMSKRVKKGDTRVADNKTMLLELLSLPQTVVQLAEKAGLSTSRTRDLVAMMKKEKLVYIKAWVMPHEKGSQAPVYAPGSMPDKERVSIRRLSRPMQRLIRGHAKVDVFASMVAS